MTSNQANVTLVTGGSTGIGRAAAIAFANRGDMTVISDIDETRGEALAEELRNRDLKASFIKTDVADEASVNDLMNTIQSKFGGLDHAFNNAGIEGEKTETADCSLENWSRTINVNLTGLFLCMKYELPIMLNRGSGVIVNMASVAGKVGFPGLPAYSASKGGVVQLTRTAALEYATRGIRINAVCPAVIQTEMIERITEHDKAVQEEFAHFQPMERAGKPEEVADCVLWLCSDKSSFITGQALDIDGGYLAR